MGPTGIAGLTGLADVGLSLGQYYLNKKNLAADEANRPQYQIPGEIGQNVNQAEQMSLEGIPEAQKQQYLANLQRGTAFGLSQIGSRKGGLAGLGTLNEEQNQGYDKLLAQDAAARMQNLNTLYGARNTMADYRNQAFQFNKVDPYYEHIARRDANTGALFQNVTGAVNTFGAQAQYNQMPQNTTGGQGGGQGGGGLSQYLPLLMAL